MNDLLTATIWLILALPAVVVLQRWIHRHLQGIALLLTGRTSWAVVLYALVLFPGVLLHELSHWLMATLLFVRTGKVALLPQLQDDGTIQLGAVEYYKTDNVGALRESLIGGAPLIAGTVAVLLISLRVFNVELLTQAFARGDLGAILLAMGSFWQTPDVLVWLYLFFAISNAMMPSASDRRAWPAFGLTLLIAGGVIYLLGLHETIFFSLARPLTTVVTNVALAFSVTIVANLFFILGIVAFEGALSRLSGRRVNYGEI